MNQEEKLDLANKYISSILNGKDGNELLDVYKKEFSSEEYQKILLTIKIIVAKLKEKALNGKSMQGKCYECKFRNNIPGDTHSSCSEHLALVKGNPHGIKNGWFFWPFNFDPIWLEFCDSFEKKEDN